MLISEKFVKNKKFHQGSSNFGHGFYAIYDIDCKKLRSLIWPSDKSEKRLLQGQKNS